MKPNMTQKQLFGIDDIAAAVTQLADRQGYAPESLISDLEDKVLGCPNRPIDEHSTPATAYVDVPEFEQPDSAVLVIHVCRIGSYLTKGNEEIRIPFNYHDNTAQTAVDRLFDSKPGSFAAINIGSGNYTVDSNLKFDVYTALMDYLAKI
ncbi:MAG: hypothetical protein ABFS39_07050 [Pseudomonadota bacterium]